jgi:hypothetical protein
MKTNQPSERDLLEVTIGRERMRVRVLSIQWPDRTGTLSAEITIERTSANGTKESGPGLGPHS